jgi:diaminohydroxyphosphoribosylaminopyrimidine deaminase/5-amino-6-(5-phosphoribosylamino)uracil reductase
VREGHLDELLAYFAPRLIGQGQGMANFGPLPALDAAIPLRYLSTDRIGDDLRIVARVVGRDVF